MTWTIDQVADRFHEAAVTARRLPPVQLQGYFNMWPGLVRQTWEGYSDERRVLRFAASPQAIDRFDVTVRWLHWLEVEQRHLIWMRAEQRPWREICAQAGCNRSTAWRRWRHALALIVVQLNGQVPRVVGDVEGSASALRADEEACGKRGRSPSSAHLGDSRSLEAMTQYSANGNEATSR